MADDVRDYAAAPTLAANRVDASASVAGPTPNAARWREAVLTKLTVLWQRWKVVARRIGDFQARVLLSIFYFGVLGPFALGVKIFSDPLRLRPLEGSGWVERPMSSDDPLTRAKEQF